MKVRVSYKQVYEHLVYTFYRIIDFTPDKKFFKVTKKQVMCKHSPWEYTKQYYYVEVKRILSMTKEEVKNAIMPYVEEYLYNPQDLYKKIRETKIDLDIDTE